MRDAVVMGVFQSPVRMSLRRVRAQCRQPAEGSFDPIGITHENHNRLTGLTPWAMLALYIEHIMNKWVGRWFTSERTCDGPTSPEERRAMRERDQQKWKP